MILGLVIGAAVADEEGLVIGFFVGLAFAMITSLKGRIFSLEQELSKAVALINDLKLADKQITIKSESAQQAVQPATNTSNEQIVEKQPIPIVSKVQSSEARIGAKNSDLKRTASQKEQRESIQRPDLAEKIFAKLKAFFTEGNVVVKVGAIVLFFGVAFLLKYAADRSVFPIELRLLGVVLAGLAMLVSGWYLRERKLEYGLVLQGAGLGVLYITVFAAGKLYELLPAGFSMIIMLFLVVTTGLLAIKQDAKSLALFGVVGGFLAPILMSTGSGSHIALFSYYAFLNVSIFGIAWFKSWRFLNLVGFIFTFAISAAWGYGDYSSELFASTEAFLVLFYFLYLTISILFAFRQAPQLKGYIDGTLVFGLPLIVFALQSELVKPFEYGQAISAVALASIYLLLAKLFWLPEKSGVRLLAESFLALAITFASLAIPLYFDGRWTAAVWSLEGAALVWVGLRQAHLISRLFGLVLSVGAGLVFVESFESKLPDSIAIINSAFIGMALVSLSALFIAYLYNKYKRSSYEFELKIPLTMIIWGLLWWFIAGINEVDRYVSNNYEFKVTLLFIALTMFAQAVLSYRLKWKDISVSTFLFTPILLLLTAAICVDDLLFGSINPFDYLGFLVWPVALFVHILLLSRHENDWSSAMVNLWHAAGMWFISLISLWALIDGVNNVVSLNEAWNASFISLLTSLLILGFLRWGRKLVWPIQYYKRSYYFWGMIPVITGLFVWQLIVMHYSGNLHPLRYIPLLNPLDMTQIAAVAVIVVWCGFVERKWSLFPSQFIPGFLAIMSFILVNIIIARTVHNFTYISYSGHSMLHSGVFQTAISIVWSIIAMALMVIASRQLSRQFWFIGAGLLALVVVKLFFVDLADSGSISRIISFLAVGGLMLVIGYLSPLPPKIESENKLV